MTSSQDLPVTGASTIAVGGIAAAITAVGAVLKRAARSGSRTRTNGDTP